MGAAPAESNRRFDIPGIASDLGDDEWKQLVCIETSNVADFAVDLAPGQQHTMKAIVRLSDL
jgi:D-hexose-6-phosphate mutarotase